MLRHDTSSVISPRPSLSSASGGAVLHGNDGRGHFVRDLLGSSEATLGCAATAIAKVEREVDLLWHQAMAAERREVSERLVEVSHVLRRASRLLEGRCEIG